MPRQYDNAFAKCPFFISSGKQHIRCEGITDDCTIDLAFVSEDKRDLHRRTYCDARYSACGICKALEEKYETKE